MTKRNRPKSIRTGAFTATGIALLVSLAAAACGDDPVRPEPDGVEIRVRNASPERMEDVLVWFPYENGQVLYGDLAPGATSGYREVEEAYRIAWVRAVVEGDSLVLHPIDYMEPPLERGRYTYRLGLHEGTSLTLELETD